MQHGADQSLDGEPSPQCSGCPICFGSSRCLVYITILFEYDFCTLEKTLCKSIMLVFFVSKYEYIRADGVPMSIIKPRLLSCTTETVHTAEVKQTGKKSKPVNQV